MPQKIGNCKIDLAGKWMQVVRGRKSKLPVYGIGPSDVERKSYIGTYDYKFHTVFDEITKILESKNM